MSGPAYGNWFHIVIGFDLPEVERAFVHTSVTEMFDELAPLDVRTDAGPLGRGPGPAEYAATIAEIVGTVSGLTAIAQAVLAWRRKVQQRAVKTTITLNAPGKDSLDLNTATDEQVRIFIIELHLDPPNNE